MKPVLVLDACQRSALAVTRSLGRRGVPVYTADETPSALSGSSRFSQHYFTHRSPRFSPKDFIVDIVDICNKQAIDIILPMTELTTSLLLTHREDLPGISIPFPELETVDKLADKCSLFRLAESLEISVPRTWYIDDTNQIPDELEALPYPLVLKPGKSWVETNGEWLHTSVRFAESSEEAKKILNTDQAFSAYSFLLQEKVPGDGQGIFALYDKGKPVAFFAHHRIREKPPSGGVSVLSESVTTNPVLQSHACMLLDSVHWHGIAMVEFKMEESGQSHLMEINTRFWGSLQLAIDAGVDFPWLLYQMTCGEEVTPVESYKKGTRLRWLLGDLDRLYIILKNGNFSVREKLAAMLSFFTPDPFRTRHEVNRWGDIRPFWWELKQYVRDMFK